jgi:asparagine synthase (glutamine-hydrolysing)
MPGIVGFIAKQGCQEDRSNLDAMVRCMMHERFYRSGTHVDGRLGLSIGWICEDGSFSDCLPVWNEEKNVCLIFAGEDFADPSDIDRLRANGHHFDSGNASYLVHLYEEAGLQFFEKLNGPFCGMLIDLREEKAVLFNDRYGLNRIYYHQNERGFYFASEAKSLLKILPTTRRLDPVGLGEFLSCGCVLQNRTLFSGIELLPAGSAWTFLQGPGVAKRAYFEKERWESQAPLSAADYYEQLESAWKRLLPRYFGGPLKVALSLTGGLDSRMILAWAPRKPGTLPCYTWGGKFRDCADVKVARQLAAVCGQEHQTILLNRGFLSDFPSLAQRAVFVSDGAMDVTGSVDLYVQKFAREIAPVRLSGAYGGEILRRMVVFKPGPACSDCLEPELNRSANQAAATYAKELQGHRLSFIAFKQAPWHMEGKFAIERSRITIRMPYFDNDLVALAYRAPADLAESNRPSLYLTAEGNPALKRFETDRGFSLGSFPGTAQARHSFKQFTFRAEYAYDYGMPQWLARFDHLAAPLHLERLFLGRHKFHHFRVWYRDELSHYVRDTLLDARALGRPYLKRSGVEEVVKSHLGGYRNHTLAIHKLLSLELIQRTLIEQN